MLPPQVHFDPLFEPLFLLSLRLALPLPLFTRLEFTRPLLFRLAIVRLSLGAEADLPAAIPPNLLLLVALSLLGRKGVLLGLGDRRAFSTNPRAESNLRQLSDSIDGAIMLQAPLLLVGVGPLGLALLVRLDGADRPPKD